MRPREQERLVLRPFSRHHLLELPLLRYTSHRPCRAVKGPLLINKGSASAQGAWLFPERVCGPDGPDPAGEPAGQEL